MAKITPHFLIDGDVFAYKAASAVEKLINFDGDNCFPVGSLSEAKIIFENKLQEITSGNQLVKFTIALSDDNNFRKSIFPSYKSNRIGKPRPVVLKPLRDWIEKTYPTMKRANLEGDDVLGILATSKVIIKALDKVIVSVDKDMLTIPGKFYDIGKDELITVSYIEANRAHMMQTLTGDTTDGYGGCPGVGAKGAEKLLNGLEDYSAMWQAVVGAYKKAGLTEADALIQGRMARILRNYDYDFKRKEPILWRVENERNAKI